MGRLGDGPKEERSRVPKMERKFTLQIAVLLVFLTSSQLLSTVAGQNISKPGKPDSWICYTTAGSAVDAGGNVNYSNCGQPCEGSANKSPWLGYVGAVLAIILFGSNFIPVKSFDTGDGIFFQWILCIGIWLVGLVVNMATYQPPFFLPALLGGVLWTTGNLMVVPIIKMIGLTMGLTVWGVTNMLSGWFSGRVILKQEVACEKLNYGGVATVVISVIILAFIKSEGKKAKTDPPPATDETTALLDGKSSLDGSLKDRVLKWQKQSTNSIQSAEDKLSFSPPSPRGSPTVQVEHDQDFSWVDRLGVWPRRIIGFSLSLVSGLLYGFQFLPVQFMKLCDEGGHSCNDMDYLFGHLTGILLVSTFYFIVYSAARRNQPVIYPRLILPGLLSGILWGIAMLGWFLANQHLSLGVSFPIVTAGPGLVSSIWGILLYREIKGWRNIVLFFAAFSVSLCGLVMDGLSRCKVNC